MVSLLYHWNFTGTNDYNVNDPIYDSEANLVAKLKSRGSHTNSSYSRNEDGIFLNNNDEESGGYYIDLEGLNTIQFGGNISIEMVIKNYNRDIKAIYFLSVGENEGTNQAFINCRYNGLTGKEKTFFSVRTDEKNDSTGVSYTNRVTSESSNTVITNNNEFHYIFSVNYDSGGSSIKIYIDGDKKGENTVDLEKGLTTDARNTNFIGTRQVEGTGVTYLNGVVKYLKIYQNSITDTEATNIYSIFNSSLYWSDYSSKKNPQKYTRKHTDVNTYFDNNSGITNFSILGSQLGLLNGSEQYKIHKFSNGATITISDKFNYIPLQGKDNYVIFNSNSDYYKVTQTSIQNNENAEYKCEVSVGDINNFNLECENKGFGSTFDYNNNKLVFGGVEFINNDNEICFHEDTIINTDQGEIKIKDLNSENTINDVKILYLVKSPNKPSNLVLIKKNALGENKPSGNLLLTENHLILVNKKLVRINDLCNQETILKIKNYNSNVYNIILLNKNLINISNLVVNTLGLDDNYLKKIHKLKEEGKKKINLIFSKQTSIHLDLEKLENF